MAHKPGWSTVESVVRNARRVLPPLAEKFFEQGRRALKRGTVPALHAFRLKTKHFRYTLELFQPIYGPGLEKHLENLRTLQRHLGEVNDCAATRRLLDRDRSPSRAIAAQRSRMLTVLARSERGAVAELRKFWSTSFDRPGQVKRWTDYLTRYAGRPRPKRRRSE
jgi:CHAD domain-containing protein